ncbi:pseudouridine synthase [uncultured Prevotella sp.]|uniref:pseudouridine synthase n=1 Tax=uncultured Prevotella sp. TaxID=159272 RepID=UPI0027E2D3CA|nr:pseudouridine synthase [uncultured Prevotella sp.]
MDSELEKNQEQKAADQTTGNSESYGRPAGNYQREYRSVTGRRPRIHTQRPYNADRSASTSSDDNGFRPEGFGAGLQGNGNNGYQQRPQNGYRPRYNQQSDDDQQQNSFGQQQGGYQPRQQSGYGQQGGYNRSGYGQQRSGYQQRGGYGQQRGGYGQQRGGYNRGGYGQQGGYNRSGYGQQRSGYQQRGGYGQQRGGYGQQRGGYNRGGYGQQGGYNRQHTPGYDPNAKYSLKKRIEYKEENFDPNEPIRLNKFLANAGICSRREADEFIQAGVVSVNGEVVTELGTKIKRTDEIKFHDQPVNLEKKVYVLLNKPKDCVTTSDDPQQRKTVMDLVKNVCPERIYPVGRLDRNTTGVLLLTNDGDLASKLTHPKFLKKKVYHVYLDKNVTAHDMQQIAEGIELEDGEIHADAIEYASDTDKSQVGIEIHSGKNRIVRRIFEHLGYRVVKLDRVQFAGLTKKNLRRGDWRFLTEKEVEMLRMGAFE